MDQKEIIQERLEALFVRRRAKKKIFTSKAELMYGLVLLISIIGVFSVLYTFKTTPHEPVTIEQAYIPKNPFDEVSLESKSAIVWDIEKEKIIFSKNGTAVYPLASVTKLMTAYTAQKHAPDILSVTIQNQDIALEGDQGLLLGEQWRLINLIDYGLVTSSNDAMSAIAAAVGSINDIQITHEDSKKKFISLMNTSAHELNLDTLNFNNESGLDDEERNVAGGYGSALDVSRLLGVMLREHPDSLFRTRDPYVSLSSINGFEHTGANTNLSTSRIPGLLASKTGFTDLAGGNLAIVFDAGLNRPVAVVVLGSSIEGRFRDIEKLVEKTRKYIKEYEMYEGKTEGEDSAVTYDNVE